MSANIKTWQERAELSGYGPGWACRSRDAEIAELRAALAATAPTVAVDEREAFRLEMTKKFFFDPIDFHRDDSGAFIRGCVQDLWNGWQARAKLSAGVTIPAGWALVPVEPTEEMRKAGGHVNSEWLNDNAPIGEARYVMPMQGVWNAVLAAAPSPDQQGE